MKPLVSVIVPAYNLECYIEKCLDSILSQKFDDFEIIIVNDGSSDNTLGIIQEYQQKSDKIKCFSYKKNQGVSYARNLGVKKASGKFILFVDGDDYIEGNMLMDMTKLAKRDKSDIVCSIKQNFIYKDKEELINIYVLGDSKTKNYILLTPGPTNKLINRDLLLDNRFPLEINYEDLAVIPSLVIQTDKISFINKNYYNYVQRENSITNQKESISKREDIFKAVDILYNKFHKERLVTAYYQELEYIYIKQVVQEMMKFYLIRDLSKIELRKKIKLLKELISSKFPYWTKNIYYVDSKFKYKMLGWLINNECLIGLKLWTKKYLKKGWLE